MTRAENSTGARETELPLLVRRRTLLRHALGVAALMPLFSIAARAQATAEQLVAAMREGGKVVFLRHAATVQEQVDTGRLSDRAGQRNLSAEGIEQAQQIGRALRALNIRFHRIVVSPVFRAKDTAELAFGAGNFTESMEVVADEYAGNQLNFMVESTRRLLRTPQA